MGKYTGPVCRIMRRYGDLALKSRARSLTTKMRESLPGEHGSRRGRPTDYGMMLIEKQKARHSYGLRERKFHAYFEQARRSDGSTAQNLIHILESRLDNIVFRMGFGSTRAEARQLISHKAIKVNDEVVNIPSYQVSPEDVVEIRDKAKKQGRIKLALELAGQADMPDWLSVDTKKMQGVVKSIPGLDDLTIDFDINKVIELYSK